MSGRQQQPFHQGGGGGGGGIGRPSYYQGRGGGRGRRGGGGGGRYNNNNRYGGGGGGRYQQHGRGRGGGGRGRGRGGGRNHGRGRGGRGNQQQTGPRTNVAADVVEEFGTPSVAEAAGGPGSSSSVCVAIEGCCHGELDTIYERLRHYENSGNGRKVDLLLCCGDFQSLRNVHDFHSIAIPPKFYALGSFHRYYAGEAVAPILTVFVGGNHEASQPLQELCYGGWVAPNIYYLGAAGVVTFRGIRIAGISGIYKSHDYYKDRYERPPYDRSTMRSVYHVRQLDVYRLQCLAAIAAHGAGADKDDSNTNTNDRQPLIDLMISHDWPQGIEQHGDTARLLRAKPFFRDEIQRNCLGSPCNDLLLHTLKPQWWFAAHLHVKFQATVKHHTNANMQQQQPNGGNDNANEPAASTTTGLVPSQVVKSSGSPSPSKSQQETTKSEETATDDGTSANDDQRPPPQQQEEEEEEAQKEQQQEESTTRFVAPSDTGTDPCKAGVASLTEQMTRFLSLDKCLPRRQYLSIVHVPVKREDPTTTTTNNGETPPENAANADAATTTTNNQLEYDPEWLAILKKTHSMTASDARTAGATTPPSAAAPTQAEVDWIRERFGPSLVIPAESFERTVPPHGGPPAPLPNRLPPPYPMMGNPQTDRLLHLLELEHNPKLTTPYVPNHNTTTNNNNVAVRGAAGIDENEIMIDEEADADEDANEIDLDDDDDQNGDDNTAVRRPPLLLPPPVGGAAATDENEIEIDEEADADDDANEIDLDGDDDQNGDDDDDNAIGLDEDEGDVPDDKKPAAGGNIESPGCAESSAKKPRTGST